ncbi:zinc finger protein 816-like isoform X1 [Trichogramma pretiosum]|uniref:zinc finger protein 816-like isoform X1 n=1 Tax=Trichogramma pretiosum TaxID=7493 RepID=UPI0006C99E08|nr:zinc finger protein 816-like isoform X1 [Trichogramma pretiosum]XP_023314070.1 zinc finger protein 816-like isoform X1 [Trichogramma pretiosum]
MDSLHEHVTIKTEPVDSYENTHYENVVVKEEPVVKNETLSDDEFTYSSTYNRTIIKEEVDLDADEPIEESNEEDYDYEIYEIYEFEEEDDTEIEILTSPSESGEKPLDVRYYSREELVAESLQKKKKEPKNLEKVQKILSKSKVNATLAKQDKKGLYMCNQCDFKRPKEAAIYRHEITKHTPERDENDLMTCKICGRKYAKIQKIINHLYGCNRTQLLFACRICPMTSNRRHRLIQHYNRVHKALGSEVLEQFLSKLRLNRNKLIRNGDMKYVDIEALPKHEENVSNFMWKYCQNCDKLYERGAANLLIKCEVCDTTFIFKCKLCDKIMQDRCNAYRHVKEEISIAVYKCAHCDYSSERRATLRNHISSKHPVFGSNESYKCGQCGKIRIGEQSYKYHLKVCMRRFECIYCSFSTNIRKQLRIHLLRHADYFTGPNSNKEFYNVD